MNFEKTMFFLSIFNENDLGGAQDGTNFDRFWTIWIDFDRFGMIWTDFGGFGIFLGDSE